MVPVPINLPTEMTSLTACCRSYALIDCPINPANRCVFPYVSRVARGNSHLVRETQMPSKLTAGHHRLRISPVQVNASSVALR